MNVLGEKTKYFHDRHGLCFSIIRKIVKVSRKNTAIVDGCRLLTEKYYRYFKGLDEKQCFDELQLQLSIFFKNVDVSNGIMFPQTFTEKVQWIKIYGNIEEMTSLADKVAVREWITKQIGEKYLVPIVGGPWDSFEEIDFSLLPDKYVIKANHGSGMNIVVKDNSLNVKHMRKLVDSWTRAVFGCMGMERHYLKIKPMIYAEQYLEEKGNLFDYKIHCFNGEPKFIQVIGDRNLTKHTGKQKNYDFSWNDIGWVFEDYPSYDYELQPPKGLREMYDIAKKLSSDFPYVRVDLYEVGDKIYFGEMTFTPAGGFYPYKGTWNREINEKLGAWIQL